MIRPAKALPSQRVLAALLTYEPETGILRWRERAAASFKTKGKRSALSLSRWWNNVFAGEEACQIRTSGGYLYGTILGQSYRAHRIIWKLVHGRDPDEIDHINGDRADNRLTNLREVTSTDNKRNSSLRDDNVSGVVGVSWCAFTKRWRSTIRVKGKTRHLGRFAEFDAAVTARRKAEREFNFHPNHGRPSRGYAQ